MPCRCAWQRCFFFSLPSFKSQEQKKKEQAAAEAAKRQQEKKEEQNLGRTTAVQNVQTFNCFVDKGTFGFVTWSNQPLGNHEKQLV